MLEKIKFTIGKPGFASLTESFQNGIVFISLNLEFNDEFKFNSKTLISNKLGLVTNNFKDAIKKIHIISNDDKKYRYYLKKMKSLNGMVNETFIIFKIIIINNYKNFQCINQAN